MTGEALHVTYDRTIAVVYCVDEHGREVAIASEPRMAHAIEEAIAYGERPLVEYERWQVVYPRLPVAVR